MRMVEKLFVFLRAFGTSWQPLGNHHAPKGSEGERGTFELTFTLGVR